ncbi:MAG: MgtC/SapB family protein [Thermomicrobiales bacterium]|nr:MgtC/SapB family protein [Thermomicrobiales bacterium]
MTNLEIFERVMLSLVAGAIIGLEREWKNKPAGVRTYALVCEGSALFMITSLMLNQEIVAGGGISDPSRIASTVVQGVGFIAGGVIFTHKAKVQGLTTAAGLWVTAAIGLAVGAGFYAITIIGVLVALFALVPMHWLEREWAKNDRRLQESRERHEEF